MARASTLLMFCLAVAAGCDDGGAELLVDLRTDYAPGSELDGVRVEVRRDGAVVGRAERVVEVGDDYLTGFRIGEFGELTAGAHRVTVRLFLDGLMRSERVILLDHPGGTFAITALVTRNCEGVVCPGMGDELLATECLGGRCVENECTPTTPARCPAPECTSDTECASSTPTCGRPVCADGVCLEVLNDAACGADERCVREVGCASTGGSCAGTLSCGLFEPACLDGLGRRCALAGALEGGRLQLAIYDPDSGRSCTAESVDAVPRNTRGTPLLFAGHLVWASSLEPGCALWSLSLDTGTASITASPCGMPSRLTPDSLAWVEQLDLEGGVIHLPGSADVPVTAPEPWGFIHSLAPGEALLDQNAGRLQPVDLRTGALGEVLMEADLDSFGAVRDSTGTYLWVVGRDEGVEVVHTTAAGAELRRVPILGLPPVMSLYPPSQYIGLGCAL